MGPGPSARRRPVLRLDASVDVPSALGQDVVAAAESLQAAGAAEGGAGAGAAAGSGGGGAAAGAGSDAALITTVSVFRVPSLLRPLIGEVADKDKLYTAVRQCPRPQPPVARAPWTLLPQPAGLRRS